MKSTGLDLYRLIEIWCLTEFGRLFIQVNNDCWYNCEGSLLPLGCFDDQSGEKSISLRGSDRLRSDPQWFPGFVNCCSWMFPERLRNKSELVGSEETRQVLTRQDTRLCSTEFFWEFFSYHPFDLFRNVGDVTLSQFRVRHVVWSTVPSTFGCFSRNCC